MNYPFRSATLDYLHGADVTAVADALMQICEHYPAPALNCAMNFLSTHDTERAITRLRASPATAATATGRASGSFPPARWTRPSADCCWATR